jgi:hypothetical protein
VPSSIFLWRRQLYSTVVESLIVSVCNYILADTQSSQSMKTFLSHGVSEAGIYLFRIVKRSDTAVDTGGVSRVLYPLVCALMRACFPDCCNYFKFKIAKTHSILPNLSTSQHVAAVWQTDTCMCCHSFHRFELIQSRHFEFLPSMFACILHTHSPVIHS